MSIVPESDGMPLFCAAQAQESIAKAFHVDVTIDNDCVGDLLCLRIRDNGGSCTAATHEGEYQRDVIQHNLYHLTSALTLFVFS